MAADGFMMSPAYDATAMSAASQQDFLSPIQAINGLEPGPWGVAVSGGADSVALLRLAAADDRLRLHVIHLDHQTRGPHSTADAQFVARLAADLGLPATIQTRRQVEELSAHGEGAGDHASLPTNPSARYRALRLTLYRRVVEHQSLQGVLLAHHADDQAETVLLRLLRGGGYGSLAGMTERAAVAGVMLRRPLLKVRRTALRDHLSSIDQPWREDGSNATADYARNRVRLALAGREDLTQSLLNTADTCRALAAWVDGSAPALPDAFAVRVLADLPAILAQASAAHWLVRQGVPPGEVSPMHVQAIVALCQDAATPPRLNVPAGLTIVRRKGIIEARRG